MASSGLGGTIDQANESSFFNWFSLSPVEAGTGGGARTETDWQLFRPSGPRFHDLVELALHVDGTGRIDDSRLRVERTFINDVSIRPFARDIAKSYLEWILPPDAAAALEAEIAAIGQFADGESTVITRSDVSWFPWRKHSGGQDAANVFAGRTARVERRFGPTRVVFENTAPAGKPDAEFRITVGAGAPR